MIKKLQFLLFLLIPVIGFGQQTFNEAQDNAVANHQTFFVYHGDSIYLKVDEEAKFPGDSKSLYNYLDKFIQPYLDTLRKDDHNYGSYWITLFVSKTGKISQVKLFNLSMSTLLSKFIVDAIAKGPNWIPAKVNEHKVSSFGTVIYTFANLDQ